MSKDDPCKYCSKPVGNGDHEQYCSQNPENLARVCNYVLCQFPGNVIWEEGDWICRHHADMRGARARLKSAKGNISFAESSLKRLSQEQEKIRLSIPEMLDKEIKAQEHLEKTKFRITLAGAKL